MLYKKGIPAMLNKKIISLLMLLTLLYGAVFSQMSEPMDRGVKRFLRGDYIGAIEDFERVLELDENEKAKRLLYKSLIKESRRKFAANKFEDAKGYLLSAKKLEPLSSDDENMLNDINVKLGVKKKIPDPEKKIEDLKKDIQKERAAKLAFRNRLNNLISQRDNLRSNLKKNKNQLNEAQARIEEIEAGYRKSRKNITVAGIGGGAIFLVVGVLLILTLRKVYSISSGSRYQLEELEEKISQRLKEADEESDELEERVARSINKMIDGQKDVVKEISLSAAGKTQTDIEEIKDKLDRHFEEQQNKLLELLNQQAQALSSEKTEKIELPGKDGRFVITDINPHVRARADGVEMIPKTITDPLIAEKMLKPYLSDPNNRVRGNACVAIYQYNPELAINALEKMAANPDKWMRLTAAWASGEIASPKIVTVLRKLMDDVDVRVKERSMKSFEMLAELKEETGDELRKMIDEYKKKLE